MNASTEMEECASLLNRLKLGTGAVSDGQDASMLASREAVELEHRLGVNLNAEPRKIHGP